MPVAAAPSLEARFAVHEELVHAVRRMMSAAATTEVGLDTVRSVTAAVEAVAARLESKQRPRVLRRPFDEEMSARVRGGETWRTFRLNPGIVPLDLSFTDRRARAELTPGALHEGPPGLVHGGVLSAVLDATLGFLVSAYCGPAVTAQLDVSYLAGTELDVPMTIEGEITEDRGGSAIRAEGMIRQAGAVTVRAVGIFVKVPPRSSGE